MTPEKVLPKRLVVKFGTENLQNGQEVFDDYARQIVWLQEHGVEVILVSSGAIQTGKEYLRGLGKNEEGFSKPQLASLGQYILMGKWRQAFLPRRIPVGQILATFANWDNNEERESVKSSIMGLLENGAIPILNENDPISDEEVVLMEKRISENDRLAQMTAFLVDADAVLFLTDEGGIYTGDPKENASAKLLTEIPVWSKSTERELARMFGETEKGKNQGMKNKWIVASECGRQGMRVAIAGREENVVLKFAKGGLVGTEIGEAVRFK